MPATSADRLAAPHLSFAKASSDLPGAIQGPQETTEFPRLVVRAPTGFSIDEREQVSETRSSAGTEDGEG